MIRQSNSVVVIRSATWASFDRFVDGNKETWFVKKVHRAGTDLALYSRKVDGEEHSCCISTLVPYFGVPLISHPTWQLSWDEYGNQGK